MFSGTTDFGDTDLDSDADLFKLFELDTSFAPVLTSTQTAPATKRLGDFPLEENTKRNKLDNKPLMQLNTVDQSSRSEKSRDSRDNTLYSPNVLKRMFPGPAGLLGKNYESCQENSNLSYKIFPENEDFICCSQQTLSTFTEGPWKMMTEDFKTVNEEQLIEKYNINYIKKNMKVMDYSYKAPFLAAIIQNLDVGSGKIPSVHITLKDMTGVIEGAILYSFYKEISKYLKIGSVLVLKQFTVLTSRKGHCLTITSNNVLVIYNLKDLSTKEVEVKIGCEDFSVQTNKEEPEIISHETGAVDRIILQRYTPEEIWKEAVAVKNSENSLKITSNKIQFSNIYNSENNPIIGKNVIKPTNSANSIQNFSETNKSQTFNKNSAIQSGEKKKFNFKRINTHKENDGVNEVKQLSVKQDWKTIFEDDDNTDSLFDDAVFQNDGKKKFDFKTTSKANVEDCRKEIKDNRVIGCHTLSGEINEKDTEMLKTILEDIDTDSLFDDF